MISRVHVQQLHDAARPLDRSVRRDQLTKAAAVDLVFEMLRRLVDGQPADDIEYRDAPNSSFVNLECRSQLLKRKRRIGF